MQTLNYISPEDKREIENKMKALDFDYIFYTVEIINEFFQMAYPDIYKVNKKRHLYVRLFCQYLWRKIADEKDLTDYSESISKLKIMFNIKK